MQLPCRLFLTYFKKFLQDKDYHVVTLNRGITNTPKRICPQHLKACSPFWVEEMVLIQQGKGGKKVSINTLLHPNTKKAN